MEAVRTNNDLEGWHNRLNRRAKGSSQLPLCIFIKVLHREASLVNMQIRLVSDKKLKRHQRSAYRAMQRRKTLRSLEAVGRRPKEFERASGGLFSPRSNKVNFNKDKQTQTKTAPLGATNSPKVKDQQFFSSHLQLGMATDPIFVDVTVEVMQGYSGSCFHLFLTATQLSQQN